MTHETFLTPKTAQIPPSLHFHSPFVSHAQIAEMQKKLSEEDPSIYDYDSVYDDIQVLIYRILHQNY